MSPGGVRPTGPTITLGGRAVGAGHPCYVVAEVGANHDRDLDVARRLVDAAAAAGADAVKFQTYSGRTLYSTKAPRFAYLGALGDRPPHELLDDHALPRDWQPVLAAHARAQGIEFLSTPFDHAAVAELDALDVAALKIASFELVDLPLLTVAAATGRPMILSTGMATLAEIDEAVRTVVEAGASGVALLQCASLYPAPPHTLDLRAIPVLEAAFGVPTGLSDHTLGIHVAPAAVALGARIVEKHVTLDRHRVGPDHPFAIEPGELAALVAHIRDVEAALGDGVKRGPSPEEAEEMHAKARRSLVAACEIPEGTTITAPMLTVKRPGTGIPPRFLPGVVGRVARVGIEADDVITWEML